MPLLQLNYRVHLINYTKVEYILLILQTQGAAMCTVMYRDIYFNDVPITSSDLIAHLVIDSKNELDVVVGVSTFSALGK